MIKEKAELSRKDTCIGAVKSAFKTEEMDERDGLKIIFPQSWVHVRESNTEPIVRIIAEAPSMEDAENLVQKVRDILSVK